MKAIVSILAVAFALAPRWASAAPTATVTGKIVFRDANRSATAGEVERLRWGHVSVELRHGQEIFAARPDANGVFSVEGPPGTYVFEYVKLGELAEFVEPHAVEARAGRTTCLGTLEVVVPDLAKDLGSNSASELHVIDDCASLRADAGGGRAPASEVTTALARPAPYPSSSLSAMDVLIAFRAEADLSKGGLSSLRGSFVLPLGKESDWLLAASVTHVSASFVDSRWPVMAGAPNAPASAAWGGTVGAGYQAWSFLEALAYTGFLSDTGRGAHGALGGASLRLGTMVFGFGGRIDFFSSGGSVGAFMIDVSPVALLGMLL